MATGGRPLDGVRVLDLSRLIPGPFGTLVLVELGARVDKVEDAGAGDYLRYMQPQRGGVSVGFAALNRGKRGLVIDLKNALGRDAFVRLLGQYDVLFEQFRPGVLDRLGIGHHSLRERHPRLIICALTGYGQTGPLRHRAGHDLNYLARSGILAMHGPGDGPPQVPGFQLADVSGGMWCALSILAALRQRDQTGEGQICDVSMTDSVIGFNVLQIAAALAGEPVARGGEVLTGGIAAYQSYLSKDGVPMALGALEPKFWAKFCTLVGVEPDLDMLLPNDRQPALKARIAAIVAERTAAEWAAFNAAHDVLIEPAVMPGELASDAHLKARQLFFEQEQDGVTTPMFRTPAAFVGGLSEDPRPAPHKGEHTREVFREAGFSDAEIDALIASGAIHQG